MYFLTLEDLFYMEGHGVFVWTSYLLALLIIIYNLFSPVVLRYFLISEWRKQQATIKRRKEGRS